MGFFDAIKKALAPDPAQERPVPVDEAELEAYEAAHGGGDTEPFDFEGDPGAWAVARRAIESAQCHDQDLEPLFEAFGIEDEAHFNRLRHAWREYESWVHEIQGEQAWRDLQQVMADADMAGMREREREAFDAATPELLEPVEGVSLQAYAGIVAKLVAGGDLDKLVLEAGMDRAKYDRVAEVWTRRMSEDTTFTIATEYGKAFTSTGNEARGTEAAPAHSWEQIIEAMEAMSAGTAVGLDPQAILANLGMTLSDYVNASQYWADWYHQNVHRDPSIHERSTELHEKYAAKYATAKNDQDIAF